MVIVQILSVLDFVTLAFSQWSETNTPEELWHGYIAKLIPKAVKGELFFVAVTWLDSLKVDGYLSYWLSILTLQSSSDGPWGNYSNRCHYVWSPHQSSTVEIKVSVNCFNWFPFIKQDPDWTYCPSFNGIRLGLYISSIFMQVVCCC